MTRLHLSSDNFIILHIRRNDLKRGCNSELDAIPTALDRVLRGCSLYNSTSRSVYGDLQELPVVLFSDESAFIYRSEVMRAVRDYGFQHTIDGDYVVHEYIEDEMSEIYLNNYVIFRMMTAMQMKTKKIILMHAHHGCGTSSVCTR